MPIEKKVLSVESSDLASPETVDSNYSPKDFGNMDEVCNSIQKLTNVVNKCFENVKINQQMINNLMIMSIRLNERFVSQEYGKFYLIIGIGELVKHKIKEGLDGGII